VFYRLFLTKIEPELSGNVFVYDYPKYQASLSRLTEDGKYGERFELYMNGLEICNGFTELTDGAEQRKRFEEESEERKLASKTVHPIDEELLSLLPSLRTPTFGNALGIDRLHMILTGRTKIEDVMLFPAEKLFK
jgi:lysyl-tRNA synthetase class 2